MKAIVALILGACAASPPPPANHVSTVVGAPPDLATLRSLLRAAPDSAFDARARERGCPADQSLRAYVAMLETQGASGDIHHVTGGCGAFSVSRLPIDPPADAAYWFCTVDAYTSDRAGESPWHYELHARIRKADRAIDLATVACPGA